MSAFDVFDSQALPPPSATEEDREKATAKSLKQVQLLLSHYGTGDDASLNAEELHKEWESFSIMLADHYSKAKTRDVLHGLASSKLKLVYPQLARLASVGLTIPFSTADCERAFSTMK